MKMIASAIGVACIIGNYKKYTQNQRSNVPERFEVYAAVEGERDYQRDSEMHQCAISFQTHVPDCNKTVSDYLSLISSYNVDLLNASRAAGPEDTLYVFRQLAAWCVACMEANGCCARDLTTGYPDLFEPGPLSLKKVLRMIDTEREWQNHLSNDYSDVRVQYSETVSGFVIKFQHTLNKAYEQWASRPDDEYTLDVIRELAGIAVYAMEIHGVLLREPFEI